MADVTPIRRGAGVNAESMLFEELIRPHFDAMYASAYRLTANAADAEDLVQDVCMKTFPRLDEFKALEHPRSWLLRVLYRRFIDMTRSKKRSPLALVAVTEDDSDPLAAIASEEPGPAEQADGLFGEERLQRAWKHLDAEHRALLALHDIEGRSLNELEAITGLPQGTLKSRLHRARIRLGRFLTREQDMSAPNLRNRKNELRECGDTIG